MHCQTIEYLRRMLDRPYSGLSPIEELITDGASYEIISDIFPECARSEYERIYNEIQSN